MSPCSPDILCALSNTPVRENDSHDTFEKIGLLPWTKVCSQSRIHSTLQHLTSFSFLGPEGVRAYIGIRQMQPQISPFTTCEVLTTPLCGNKCQNRHCALTFRANARQSSCCCWCGHCSSSRIRCSVLHIHSLYGIICAATYYSTRALYPL